MAVGLGVDNGPQVTTIAGNAGTVGGCGLHGHRDRYIPEQTQSSR